MKKRKTVILCAVILIVGIAGVIINKRGNQTYTIGICQFTQHEALDAATQGFEKALTDQLGDRVAFELQNAQGDYSACSTIINRFISDDVNLILANSTASLQTAATSTTEIPILGTAVTDYAAALQLNNFSGTTGRNISGTSDLASLNEQAAMIQEMFPDANTIGLLYCPSEPNSTFQIDTMQTELEKLNYVCSSYTFSDSGDITSAAMAASSECDVIYIPTDNTIASNAELLANICIPDGTPIITGDESTCRICGVATLSIDYYDLGYTTGEMAAHILTDGKDISDMPVEYASQYTKRYNRTVCEKLGISVPADYTALDSEE